MSFRCLWLVGSFVLACDAENDRAKQQLEPADETPNAADRGSGHTSSEAGSSAPISTTSSSDGGVRDTNGDAAIERDAGPASAVTAADSGRSGDAGAVANLDDGGSPLANDAGPLGALRLMGLEFVGVEEGPYPALDTGAQHFAVQLPAGEDELSVVPTVGSDVDITIEGELAESGEPFALSEVDVGTVIDIDLSGEGSHREYSVIVLPPDFPEITAVVREDSASTDPIYVSLVNRDTRVFFVAKLDNFGVPTFFRRTERVVFDFKRQPNGFMSYAEDQPVRGGGVEHVVLDEHGVELERLRAVGKEQTDPHEFRILPGGEYLLVSYEPTMRDLTPFGGDGVQEVEDGILQRLSADKEVLFEWNSFEHMNFDESVYGKSDTDYAHLNSVVLDADGNYIVSSRGFSQVLKLDGVSGEVLWRLGGISSDFEFIGDPYSGFCGQHTATLVGENRMLIFDNGQFCVLETPERGELTRVVEYELDEQALTATLVWSYERPEIYTDSQGSSQRLSNGNTFIGWGSASESLATEVDHDGTIVFDLAVEPGFTSYRAVRLGDG